MEMLVFVLGPFVLAGVAMAMLAVRRLWPLIASLGLAIAVLGTFMGYSSSATLMERGSIGVGLGWLMTAFYALMGLGVLLVGLNLAAVRFIALPTVAAGLTVVGPFYAFLPPWGWDPGPLWLSAPGVAIAGLGVWLLARHGLLGAGRFAFLGYAESSTDRLAGSQRLVEEEE